MMKRTSSTIDTPVCKRPRRSASGVPPPKISSAVTQDGKAYQQYSCLVYPYDTEFTQALKLQNCKTFKTLFYVKHKQCNSPDGVLLNMKCIGRKIAAVTVFTKVYDSESEFLRDISRRSEGGAPVFSLDEVYQIPHTLSLYSVINRETVDNLLLKTSQTNILTLLNKSFTKSDSDPVTWYVNVCCKLLCGDNSELPNVLCMRRFTRCFQSVISDIDATVVTNKIRLAKGVSHDIIALYEAVFGGQNIVEYITLARMIISVSTLAMQNTINVYKAFNSDRHTNIGGCLTFANSQFIDTLNDMFKTPSDLLTSEYLQKDKLDDKVKEFWDIVKRVASQGSTEIVQFLKDNIRVTDFDPQKHSCYNLTPPTDRGDMTKYGTTPPEWSGPIAKRIIPTENPFPGSMCKQFRGVNSMVLASLCNSDRVMVMSGEPVKKVLQRLHGVQYINRPMLSVARDNGYQYCILIDKNALDVQFATRKIITAIKKHTQNPSMITYSDVIDAFDEVPSLYFNEVINDHLTVFTLPLDIDSAELISTLYSSENTDTWELRAKIHDRMKSEMVDYLQMLNHDGTLTTGGNGGSLDFTCSCFESRPDSKITKVGLRVIFRFKGLSFANISVAHQFVLGYQFFLSNTVPVIAHAIDMRPFTNATKSMRLPGMYKTKESRQLIYVPTDSNTSFFPSKALVHAKNSPDGAPLRVITRFGNIAHLKLDPDTEASKLCEKAKRRDARQLRMASFYALNGNVAALTSFVQSQIGSIMTAIHGCGGGVESDALTGVKLQQRSPHTILLTPRIHWCVKRRHGNPAGNPCSYSLKLMDDNRRYSLFMFCFACGVVDNIYVGDLPAHLHNKSLCSSRTQETTTTITDSAIPAEK